jgi:exonuclease SbcC
MSPYGISVRLAAERARLQAELSARLGVEDRADQDRRKRDEIARMVAAAAVQCGLRALTSESAVEAMQQWSTSRNEHLRQVAMRQDQWTRFQTLLDGKTLDQLSQEASTARQHAAELAASADPAMIDVFEPAAAVGALSERRDHAREVAEQAARAHGDLDRYAAQVPSVPEAEETLAAAEEELARVRDLQETLVLTRSFLEAAQRRIHRDIAPALAATVRQWLPELTDGRYTDVLVNPTTLAVHVCGSSRSWRPADQLSYGTAEQIYLLLRIALVDHLTRNHDTCPLILDDATVHADTARTDGILTLLLKIAAGRQIILFTQEDHVAAWAKTQLTSPDHAICVLQPVTVT